MLLLPEEIKNAEDGHGHQEKKRPINPARIKFLQAFCIHPAQLFFKSVSRPESFVLCHLSFPLLATESVTFHFLFLLGAVVNGVVTACFGKIPGNRLFGGFLPKGCRIDAVFFVFINSENGLISFSEVPNDNLLSPCVHHIPNDRVL